MRPVLVALLVLLPSPHARPVWFDAGHRVVVRIALTRITPATRTALDDLLGGQDPVEAALWADQIRGARCETSALHYVNIPLTADRYDPARDCVGGRCIIAEIERDRAVLGDGTAPRSARSEALRFLLHLVGDLHQPLHVADDRDRGGNQTEVSLFDRTSNLHRVWDGELIERAGLGEEAYLARLRARMAMLDLDALSRGSVTDWAMEGHRLATLAYRLPRGNNLQQPYLEENLPRVDLAIIEAGVRLARLLDESLAGYRPQGPSPSLGVGVYSDAEAAGHEGEDGVVVGVVVTVRHTPSGNSYLNFGADYPHQSFSGAVLSPTDPALTRLDTLAGRRIGVRGKIQRYKGQLEIVIRRADQIVAAP